MRERNRPAVLFLGSSALFLAGCFGDEDTIFPAGLEPLEECTVTVPPLEDGVPPEIQRMRSGKTDGLIWAHSRAYIHKDLKKTWAAMHTPLVSVDRRAVEQWTIELDTEPDYAFSYRIHNWVDDIINVEFDMSWRHGPVEGTVEEPTVVAGRWQKTSGTSVIEVLRGSVVAREFSEGITEIEFVEHLKAFTGSEDQILSFLEDYYTNIRAHSYGEPLPEH